ncbi:MAG: sulfite exporter TauE/SafE family protein [Planctomycetota bacterium]|nr:MAG: sulfite exporter TauE/SafE family protein [Planctomycetota bacterium]
MTDGPMDPLVFLAAGLAASGHCVGMCGPFALLAGRSRTSPRACWADQLVFASGRLCTYAFLGAMAGFAGRRLTTSLAWLPQVQAALSLAAAALMLLVGLSGLGVVLVRTPRWLVGVCGVSTAFRSLLAAPSRTELFAAGLFNGVVPCGIVYAMLALAFRSADPWYSGLCLLAFGAGTLPALTALGAFGASLTQRIRVSLVRGAAAVLVVAACVTAMRGALAWRTEIRTAPACPLCHEVERGDAAAGPGRMPPRAGDSTTAGELVDARAVVAAPRGNRPAPVEAPSEPAH